MRNVDKDAAFALRSITRKNTELLLHRQRVISTVNKTVGRQGREFQNNPESVHRRLNMQLIIYRKNREMATANERAEWCLGQFAMGSIRL